MKRFSTLLAATALAVAASPAFADCLPGQSASGDTTGSVASSEQKPGEVSKDGSMAPLQNDTAGADVTQNDQGTTTNYGTGTAGAGNSASASASDTMGTANATGATGSGDMAATSSDVGAAGAGASGSGGATSGAGGDMAAAIPGTGSAGSATGAGTEASGVSGSSDTASAGQDTGAAVVGGAEGSQAASAGGISKDGRTMPLAEGQGGGEFDVATSGQDAEMQQKGGDTAAHQAMNNTECK